jgi:uncharacterized protein (TIGR03437 family)
MLMFGTVWCLLGLGFSDTAIGQITTSPAGGMAFQVQSGGATATQTLNVSTPNATTLVVMIPAGQTWLSVNNNPQSTTFFPNTPGNNNPVALLVQVNTANLSFGQTVSANILISILNVPNSQVSYTVSLTVGTPSLLSASPATLSFSAISGNSFGSPTSTPVTISSSGSALNYNVSASTNSGGTWLLLTNTLGISTNSTSPGFSVSVNASSLGVGTYQGTITVQSTTTADSTTILVTLSVTQGAALNVTPTSLNPFAYQAGSGTQGVLPQTQNLMISTSSGSLNYQVTVTPTSGSAVQTTNWLYVNPTGGLATTTPQTISLSLVPQVVATLQAGTYGINLSIAPTGVPGGSTNNTVTIPVTLLVSKNGILSVNNSSLTFTVPFASTTTQSQSIQVTSSNGASIPYLVQTNQTWLTTTPTSGTTVANSVLTVTVNASGLAVSNTPYTGTITLYPENGDTYVVQINVTLTVTAATSTLYAAPAALLFSYETTKAPPGVQLVSLSSTGSASFTVTTNTMNASNCPTSNWLTAAPNQTITPATLTVSVQTSGMASGFCTGTIIITYNNGATANATVNIPVTVDIASTALLTVTPANGFGVVNATYGSSSVLQSQIYIGSTDGSSLGYSAFAQTPGAPVAWLSLGNSQGTGQEYLTVFIVPTGLPIGVYTGQIIITASVNSTLPSGSLTIPVVLTVSANTTVAVSPTSLTFTQAQNATTAPTPQNITLSATGGSTGFTASVTPITGGNWLQITPLSGTATGTITASVVVNQLSVGSYTSSIQINFLNAATPAQTVTVTLVVTSAQTVTVSTSPATSPTALAFSYQLGSPTPATQNLLITSTGGAIPVTLAAASSPAWLVVTPTTGSTGANGTPLTAAVSINTSVLTVAQTYTGTISVTPQGQTAISVPVTLTVTGVPPPQLFSISNSASGAFGTIAPGELITIKGSNLGPTTATSFTVGAGGTLSSTLGGVQVLFDTIAGTPIYVSPTQINVIVPYEIAGRSSTSITVTYVGQVSGAIPQTVGNQAPGIFTDSSTGVGQASVLNQNGTLNGPSSGLVIGTTTLSTTPAPQNSVISVYMTGGGQTNPASGDGTVTPGGATLYKVANVQATINGVPATVQFAGDAPGLVTGVMQVNILVPTGVTGSALPLTITVNGVATPNGPTVAVQ